MLEHTGIASYIMGSEVRRAATIIADGVECPGSEKGAIPHVEVISHYPSDG